MSQLFFSLFKVFYLRRLTDGRGRLHSVIEPKLPPYSLFSHHQAPDLFEIVFEVITVIH